MTPEEQEARIAELETTLTERNNAYTKLEVVAQEAKAGRDKIKGLVKTTFGLSEITEDSLSAVSKNVDEAMQEKIKELNDEKGQFQSQLDEVNTKHDNEMSKLILSDTLRGLGIDSQSSNGLAFEQITQLVLNDATRENSEFVFKDKDGITLFGVGGKPLTVKERVATLQKGDYSFLFKPTAGAGVGQDNAVQSKAPQGGTPLTKHISENYLD